MSFADPLIPAVILSKGREDTISKQSLRLFPKAWVCVEEKEVPTYRRALGPDVRLIPHPPFKTYGRIANWVMDNLDVPGPYLQLDDDMLDFMSFTGRNPKIYTDPELAWQVIENLYIVASDFGVGLAGFNPSDDLKTYRSYAPFHLNGFIHSGCALILDRKVRYDDALTLRDDIDLNLSHLMANRITLMDKRFRFRSQPNFTGSGGNAEYRSMERDEQERAYLERKWGQYIWFGHRNGTGGTGKAHAAVSIMRVTRSARYRTDGGNED